MGSSKTERRRPPLPGLPTRALLPAGKLRSEGDMPTNTPPVRTACRSRMLPTRTLGLLRRVHRPVALGMLRNAASPVKLHWLGYADCAGGGTGGAGAACKSGGSEGEGLEGLEGPVFWSTVPWAARFCLLEVLRLECWRFWRAASSLVLLCARRVSGGHDVVGSRL